MSRPLTATVTSPTGTPLEGELIVLAGDVPVHGITDAGGGVTLAAEVTAYTLAMHAPLQLDGTLYLPGTVLRIDVPEGEEPTRLATCIVEVIDASLPALLARLATLEAS